MIPNKYVLSRPDFEAIKRDLAELCERHNLPVGTFMFVKGNKLHSRAVWRSSEYNRVAADGIGQALKAFWKGNLAQLQKLLDTRHRAEQVQVDGGPPRTITSEPEAENNKGPNPGETPNEQLPE